MNTDDLIFTLKNDISAEVIQQIRNDKTIYQDFKQSVINSFTNKIFDENLMGFALLTALNFDDNEFIEMLSNHFDFDDDKYSFRHKKIRNAWITFAKAYVCLKNSKRDFAKAIFWKIFAEVSPNYFNKNDFNVLVKLFAEMENIGENYFLLLSYCIAKFENDKNDNLDFKIAMAMFQLDNINNKFTKHLHFENNYQSNLDLLYSHITDPIKLNQIAEYCGSFSDKENFFRFNELSILNINTKLPVLAPPPIIQYNPKTCLESVNKIIDILESIGEKPFFTDGTLLGMIREGKFIDHDYDADLGLLIDANKFPKIDKKSMESFITNLKYYIEKDGKFNVVICDDDNHYYLFNIFNNITMDHIDLVFYYQNFFNYSNCKKYYGGAPSCFVPTLWEHEDFHLIRRKFNDKYYWIPNNPEYYLEEIYGDDWRVPKSLWGTISCKNSCKESKMAIYTNSISGLVSALCRRNYERSNYVYKELQRWEYPFTSEMKNHIESYLEQIKSNNKYK